MNSLLILMNLELYVALLLWWITGNNWMTKTHEYDIHTKAIMRWLSHKQLSACKQELTYKNTGYVHTFK